MSAPDDDAGSGAHCRPEGVKSPRSAGQLLRSVRAYAKLHGLAEKRVKDRIAYMVLGGAIESAQQNQPYFTFRGGVALELRRQGVARATKDLDLTYSGPDADLVRALESAIQAQYGRFKFRRVGRPLEMTAVATTRVEIAVTFDGAPWTTVAIDLSAKEDHELEVEHLPAFDIQSDFGINGPTRLPCISERYHLAHKLHGMTVTRLDGKPNERTQDAIDVLLLRDTVHDLRSLRAACVDVFTVRGTHAWPPTFAPPEGWADQFAAMARDLALDVRDIVSATAHLQRFIDAIEGAKPTND